MKRYTIAALAAVALLAAAFVAGRYTAPAKVETKTETRFVDRVVTAEVVRTEQVQGPVRIVTRWREVPAPSGGPPTHEVEQVEERGPVTSTTSSASATASETTASSSTTKVVESARPRFAFEVGARWRPADLQLRPARLDAAAGLRLAGPVWAAATADAPTDQLGDLGAYLFGIRLRLEH